MEIYEATTKTNFFYETFHILLKLTERHEGNDLWKWFKDVGLPF